jgi:heme/copper-type cytochrome/quinol oxidase subunit 2
MGLPLLKTYQMIFDYNKEDLLFYSNENKAFVQMPSRNENYVLWFFFYLILFFVVAFVFGVGLIYFLRRKNKKRKYIEEQIYENF